MLGKLRLLILTLIYVMVDAARLTAAVILAVVTLVLRRTVHEAVSKILFAVKIIRPVGMFAAKSQYAQLITVFAVASTI